MADAKLSQLPSHTTPVDGDSMYIVNSGISKYVTWANIKATVGQIGKNAIINGDFSIQQYPTDIDTAPVAMVNNTYQIDRFMSIITGVTGTIQRLAKSLINGRYVRAVKCVATSTASGTIGLTQKLEVFYNGETKSFGVWVKSDNANARALLNDGVTYTTDAHTGGGAYEFLSFPKTISGSATRLWAYAIISDASGAAVSINTGDYIESTMWQVEDGTVATPFEQRLPGLELSLCKRYLPYRSIVGDAFTIHGKGYGFSSTQIFIDLDIKTAMAVVASAVSYVGNLVVIGGGGALTVTGLAIYAAGTDKEKVTLLCSVASGGVVNEAYVLRNNNDTTAYIQVSTEL